MPYAREDFKQRESLRRLRSRELSEEVQSVIEEVTSYPRSRLVSRAPRYIGKHGRDWAGLAGEDVFFSVFVYQKDIDKEALASSLWERHVA